MAVAWLVEAAAVLVDGADVLAAELLALVVGDADDEDEDDDDEDEDDEPCEVVEAETELVPPPEPEEQPVRANRPRLATAPTRVEVGRDERSVRQVFMASP